MLEGFDYALDPNNGEAYNIRVISNSWGTSGDFAPFNPINIASKRAYDEGLIVDFAAGNAGPGENTLNPYSASPCVMSVAAGDKSSNLANFSSRGVLGNEFAHPDITTLGVQIIAARRYGRGDAALYRRLGVRRLLLAHLGYLGGDAAHRRGHGADARGQSQPHPGRRSKYFKNTARPMALRFL